MLLYSQCDESSCVPLPQVTEQAEPILQDDQAGHISVLHGSFLVRMESPLAIAKQTKSWFTITPLQVLHYTSAEVYVIRDCGES